MGGIPFMPKLKRCCGCTRKLKVACIFIVFWSMLATTHSIRILFCPTCHKQYTKEGGPWYYVLTIVMWVLFVFDMLTLGSSFLYFLGLFLGYRFSADLFMALGFVTSILMFFHAVFNILQLVDSDCSNPSDIIAHFIYVILWWYFILIVNSHRDNM